jgi:hypothetical protein
MLAVLGLLVASSTASYADSCAAGSLGSVMGTVCTIGNLTFDFTGTASGYSGFNSQNTATGQEQLAPLTPEQIEFIPVVLGNRSGFTLLMDLSANAPLPGNQFNQFQFFYGVSTTDGSETLLSVDATGRIATDGGFDAAGAYGDAYASVFAYGCNMLMNCTQAMTWSSNGTPDHFSIPVVGAVKDLNWYGFTQFYAGAINYGNDAHSSITSGTILYQTVPEPGTLALLGVGLLGFTFRKRT